MTPKDLKSAGLKDFAQLTDEEATEVVDTIEQLLMTTPEEPDNVKDRIVRASLEGFVYGYRLGSRPK
ncbi:hypothetical protein [Kocuria sp. cx-455]|uniref:hypothetical protein n=1 Tax=Kocuria sp. cx-455 TaxID=2771377 RepID=UPI003D74E3A7